MEKKAIPALIQPRMPLAADRPGAQFIVQYIKSYLKIRILAQGQGGSENQPAGILKYVEVLKRGTNAEIGLKNIFEMISITKTLDLVSSTTTDN